MPSKDLRSLLEDWPYVPGQISVRRVRGSDNRIKIQMRVDLGVLQMEVVGRPDGSRPHGYESLLEYHQDRLEGHRRRNGTELGYTLDSSECREVREEAMQYYHRYLANFVLEDYDAVARDTKRNLDVLDMMHDYADEDDDRFGLEVYRPYLVMMHSQSKALGAIRQGAYRSALAHVESGLRTIRTFFKQFGQPKAYRRSAEVEVLHRLRREIRRHLPVDPIRVVRRKLRQAIEQERYEDAARLRDELTELLREHNTSE